MKNYKYFVGFGDDPVLIYDNFADVLGLLNRVDDSTINYIEFTVKRITAPVNEQETTGVERTGLNDDYPNL